MRRNAVLPLPPGGAGKKVGGARLKAEACPLPLAIAERLAKAKAACRSKRQTHHFAENRPVLVPADGRAGHIFCNQDLLQVAENESGCRLNLFARFPQKRRDRISRQLPAEIPPSGRNRSSNRKPRRQSRARPLSGFPAAKLNSPWPAANSRSTAIAKRLAARSLGTISFMFGGRVSGSTYVLSCFRSW